jgi:uncharacterized membrane protein
MDTAQVVFQTFVKCGILAVNVASALILLVTAGLSFVRIFKKDLHVRIEFSEGIALALEFKLAGEVLRTLIVRSWDELGMLGVIVVLCGAITFLIRWEIKNEKKNFS